MIFLSFFWQKYEKKELVETMKIVMSKLTQKYQATIPEPVRKNLRLQSGDRIAFEIDGEVVRVRKSLPMDRDFLSALEPTLSEWRGVHDEEAYDGL